MELLQNTLYINLEHRTDRLKSCQTQFEKMGIRAERFNAIKTKNGAIGCTLSHIKCLELAIEREYEQIFICEDDILFLDTDVFSNSLTKFHENKEIEWDVLIISGNNCPPFQHISDYCIRVFSCQTTTGYVVKKHYYQTLINNMREGVKKLLTEPDNKKMYAVDMYWKSLQRINNWYLITPLSVVQGISYSDVEQCDVNYVNLMLDLEKPWAIVQPPQL